MKAENLLDFEDLLLKVREIFTNYPDILEKYAEKFRYVLVDEFQDTNLIQYEIVRMLTKKVGICLLSATTIGVFIVFGEPIMKICNYLKKIFRNINFSI